MIWKITKNNSIIIKFESKYNWNTLLPFEIPTTTAQFAYQICIFETYGKMVNDNQMRTNRTEYVSEIWPLRES